MATLIILNLLIVRAIRKSYSFRALLAQRGAGQAQASLTLMCCGVVGLETVVRRSFSSLFDKSKTFHFCGRSYESRHKDDPP